MRGKINFNCVGKMFLPFVEFVALLMFYHAFEEFVVYGPFDKIFEKPKAIFKTALIW